MTGLFIQYETTKWVKGKIYHLNMQFKKKSEGILLN